jgi:hypothetical protein
MSFGIVASVGSAIVGASIASSGAKSAAKTQAAATDRAVDAQNEQFRQTREDFAPYREVGYRALGQLESSINTPVTSADVMADPGYQFGLEQGQQALDRKFAASGGRISGASMKAASRFNVGTATSGYNAAYQRRQDRLNRLASLAGIGQTATGSSAAAGQGAANAISGLVTAQGNASGASQMAQGNIWGNAINQTGAALSRGIGGGGYGVGYTPASAGAFGGYTGDYNALAYQP